MRVEAAWTLQLCHLLYTKIPYSIPLFQSSPLDTPSSNCDMVNDSEPGFYTCLLTQLFLSCCYHFHFKGWQVKWSNSQILKLLPANMRMLLKCVSGAAEMLRFPKFGACVHRVCIFFIAFLYNSCNFQYLILGLTTLLLSPSYVSCIIKT